MSAKNTIDNVVTVKESPSKRLATAPVNIPPQRKSYISHIRKDSNVRRELFKESEDDDAEIMDM